MSFQWQIKSDRLDRLHERRPAPRITEDDQFGRPQCQSCFCRTSRVIDSGTFIPLAWISVAKRSIVSFGPKRLGMVVRPSVLLGESDAGINQPGEKITIDHEATPFCIVI